MFDYATIMIEPSYLVYAKNSIESGSSFLALRELSNMARRTSNIRARSVSLMVFKRSSEGTSESPKSADLLAAALTDCW